LSISLTLKNGRGARVLSYNSIYGEQRKKNRVFYVWKKKKNPGPTKKESLQSATEDQGAGNSSSANPFFYYGKTSGLYMGGKREGERKNAWMVNCVREKFAYFSDLSREETVSKKENVGGNK